MMKEQLMVEDLADFVQANREDQLGDLQSLYAELLHQWRLLSRYTPTNRVSERLSDTYWAGMAEWYDHFVEAKDRIGEPDAMPTPEMQQYYIDLVTKLADEVMATLPELGRSQVIDLTDFLFLLEGAVKRMRKLDIYSQSPIDCTLLIYYWQVIDDTIKELKKDDEN